MRFWDLNQLCFTKVTCTLALAMGILDIKDGKINVLATLGKPPCGSTKDELNCGRPLGLRMHEGSLYVVDAYLGLFKVSVETGKARLLLSQIAGVKPTFLNDLDIDSNGVIYISDSCRKWQRREFMYPCLEGTGSGRLIRFDPHNNSTEVLIDGLHFANGVQLSPDEDFVLVVEGIFARILRYHLKGHKKGQVDTFVENLPGVPDNIRPSSGGGYWLCDAVPHGPGFSLFDFLAPRPLIRRLLTQLFSLDLLVKFPAPSIMVYELNAQGEIVRSFWDLHQGHLGICSEVNEHDGVLYTGSIRSPFIGRFDLTKMKKT
ncbi:hypothetical protein NP493_236g03081 [Ridgeia piscesae]|uniref:Strictosidine synthase conserved region domain-containing protein n=1 Tax=Ridgeia piscesae TaxID=27915 RepID=A0AAD9UDH3_RIDPI|nr:hypothetical protein NP493_236g03081 [Ridgeia piscesae]